MSQHPSDGFLRFTKGATTPKKTAEVLFVTFNEPDLFDLAAEKLLPHLTHRITITAYGGEAAPDNIAIECEECAEILVDFLAEGMSPATANTNVWSEHSTYSRAEWRSEVANQNTQLGYWDWCLHKTDECSSKAIPCSSNPEQSSVN